jgi:type III secretory pathway component EscS
MTNDLHDLFIEGIRALFLISVPITLGVAIAGSLAGLVQTVTTLQDSGTAYAVRLIGLILVLYSGIAVMSDTIVALAERALR